MRKEKRKGQCWRRDRNKGWERTCINVGLMVSFIKTVAAPPTPKSSQVKGCPFLSRATTMRPILSRMSVREVAKARIAII